MVECLAQSLVPQDWKPDPTQPLGYVVFGTLLLILFFPIHASEGFLLTVSIVTRQFQF